MSKTKHVHGHHCREKSRNWSRAKAKRVYLRFRRWAAHYMHDDSLVLPTQWFRIHNAWLRAEDRSEGRRYVC